QWRRNHPRRHPPLFPTRRSSDLAALAGALEPTLPDLNLEIIARWLGVEVTARHTAIGDCLTAARAFAMLFERLRIRGVRTLGERSEEHTSELQSRENLVCRLLLE